MALNGHILAERVFSGISEREKSLHSHAIDAISARVGSPVEEVIKVYRIVPEKFARSARVKDFFPLLVSKRVQYLLMSRKDGAVREASMMGPSDEEGYERERRALQRLFDERADDGPANDVPGP